MDSRDNLLTYMLAASSVTLSRTDTLRIVALAISYYLAGRLGLLFAPENALLSAVWPASGVAFGFVLCYGYRVWPGIFVGSLTLFAQLASARGLPIATVILLSCGFALAFTLEPVIGRWLMRGTAWDAHLLNKPKDIIVFTAVVITITCIAATMATLACHAAGLLGDRILSAWLTQWLASAAAICVLTPLFIAVQQQRFANWSKSKAFEAVAILLAFTLILPLIFGLLEPHWMPLKLPIVALPLLLWVVFRFELFESSLIVLLIAVFASWATLQGLGPFVVTGEAPLSSLQAFLCVASVSILSIGATATDNKASHRNLRELNEKLEQRVHDRTEQLEARTRDLDESNLNLTIARAHLNKELVEKKEDLELAVEEIESFTHSVSHDLRSPLRAIDGFSHALLEEYGDKLDAKAQDYLRRSRAASQRMAALLDDVLQLSRFTQHEVELDRVDLTTLAHDVIAEINITDPQRDVEFVVEKYLSVKGDEQLLRVVLENLLSNAWKFSHTKQHARIEFGRCENQENEHKFFIKDNGIGFDMEYSAQAFEPFKRLHNPVEYEGTGIGLATVKRIMQRHSGKVEVEAKVGVGATFYISFPEHGRVTGPRKAINI